MEFRLSTCSVGVAAIATALVGLSSAPAAALPLPVTTAQAVAGEAPLVGVHYTGWRHRHYRPRHYRHVRYHRRYYRPDPGLAIAGAALGLLGAAAARPYYYDYPYSYYGGYYPVSHGYYPTYSYGYPYYGYPYRRAYWGGGWGGGWRAGAGHNVVYGRWYAR